MLNDTSQSEIEYLQNTANDAYGLALDAIASANSGYLAMPLGCSKIGAALFGKLLRLNPQKLTWNNRDRFVLSAGHGSMFLYAWLHFSGYDISLEDIKNFRKTGSKTAGHPEFIPKYWNRVHYRTTRARGGKCSGYGGFVQKASSDIQYGLSKNNRQ